MPILLRLSAVFALLCFAAACALPHQVRQVSQIDRIDITQLWEAPADPATLDLFHGASGQASAPDASQAFTFVAEKKSGASSGFDVRDVQGRQWDVKLGIEAQSEVAASRLLFALGYHQPPTYYLPSWTMSGAQAGQQSGGRFRPRLDGEAASDHWSWYQNPFVGTQEWRGLLVAQTLLANWDLKSSNNRIYRSADGKVRYVVRDLGASLGVARQFPLMKWMRLQLGQGTKNDLPGFERQTWLGPPGEDRLRLAYSGVHDGLMRQITRADVRRTCERLAALSDQQWDDLFRAAGYEPDARRRYTAAFKARIAQGLALAPSSLP